jgi:predicted Zn finger-like uncharacterized protein
MSLRVTCPECNAAFSVDDDMRGKKVRCRECDHAFSASTDEGEEGFFDPDENAAPSPRRSSRDEVDDERPTPRRDRDDEDSARPGKTKAKGGMVPVLLIVGGGMAVLGVVCSGLIVVLSLVFWPSDNHVVVAQNGPPDFGQPMPFPPPFPMPDQNPPVINLDPDPAPVVEPNPKPNPDPKADPNPDPKANPDPAPVRITPDTRDKVKQSTAYLHVRMPNGAECEGSGFFAIEPGIVITNAHVLGMMQAQSRPPTNVDVVVRAGQAGEQTLPGKVLGVDRLTDLAILRVPGNGLPPPLPVESAGTLGELQNVYFFGYPFGKKLGTEISIGAGTVASIRKDLTTGSIVQVQFNGDMQPGNSGGPVVDAAGRVVGIAVAIIPNTRINFAVAGDAVRQILDGRIEETTFGERFKEGNQVKLPVKYHLINPLGRVASVRVDVWTGNPGPDRAGLTPAPGDSPPQQPGDGRVESAAFGVADGAASGDVVLPAVQPGQVIWMRPVLMGATERYLTATALKPYPYPPLDRVAANLQMKMDKPGERTLKLNDVARITVLQGKMKATEALHFEADVLEVLNPEDRGTGVRLTIGGNRFNDEFNGKQIAMQPVLSQRLRTLSPTFLVDGTGRLRQRGDPSLPTNLPQNQHDDLAMMYNRVCNAFEHISISMPNRVVNARETWPVKMPTKVGKGPKPRIVDLDLVCTYDGSRTNAGRTEAVITVRGQVRSRDANSKDPLTIARGRVVFDVEAGLVARMDMKTSTEMELGQAQMLVTDEISLVRVPGNTQNIIAVAKADPKTNPKTEPKTEPKVEPKAPVIVKNVLKVDGTIGNNDFLGPNGRKHKNYDVKLQAGVTYIIEMKQMPNKTGTSLNPFLMLQDAAGKELAKDDDSGGNKDAKIVYTAAAAGTYRVIATTRVGLQIGAYHLTVTAKE